MSCWVLVTPGSPLACDRSSEAPGVSYHGSFVKHGAEVLQGPRPGPVSGLCHDWTVALGWGERHRHSVLVTRVTSTGEQDLF
jgi:hypothetical protein